MTRLPAPPLPTSPRALTWKKSSYSGENGACVEVAAYDGRVAVRDSKNHAGPVFTAAEPAWAAFILGLARPSA